MTLRQLFDFAERNIPGVILNIAQPASTMNMKITWQHALMINRLFQKAEELIITKSRTKAVRAY